MTTPRTRGLAALGALTLAVGGVFVSAGPAAAASIPSGCVANTTSYGAGGQAIYRSFSNGKWTTAPLNSGDKLGFVPLATVNIGGYGDSTGGTGTDLAIHPDGTLYYVTRVTKVGQPTKITMVKAGTGWGGTRALALTYQRSTNRYMLYRLYGNSLVRYPFTITTGKPAFGARQVISAAGWGNIRTIKPAWSSVTTSDAILGIHGPSGYLREYRFNQTTTAMTAKVLGTGWGSTRVLQSGYCNGSTGVAFVGIRDNNTAYVYYDPKPADFSGTGMYRDSAMGSGFVEKSWAFN